MKALIFALLSLTAAMGVAVALALLNQSTLNHTQEIRYRSRLLADELRNSSEDLTRMARSFLATLDPQYEREYWHILAVRNGEAPRPNGEKRSIPSRMQELGFTADELVDLEKAEDRSNALVRTEIRAMNALKGPKPNLELARNLMYDPTYVKQKNSILGPISDVERILDLRTNEAVKIDITRGDLLLSMIGIFMLLTALTGIALGVEIARQRRQEEDRVRAVDQLGEAVRLRDEFLSVASHELKTPLTSLIMRLQVIQKQIFSDAFPKEERENRETSARSAG